MVRTLAVQILPFQVELHLHQYTCTREKGQQERGEGHPSQTAGKPSRQKYKSRESQSSGPAGCLVHAVPGAATAASEYKLLKVSEYEAKLLKVRGSKRDMDQRHVLYTQMP